ncbi:preprotein translocase subunit SecY [Dyadobacter sediminis]|uniref:Protein translocase subunit SecY n=1 Tax=Dyadobacter sediminis TaxID=1493691 RepID=A0A5R9K8U9_9BACT|nr:preprotein translocase subunit SecY [Dyadobacter sediminis]TLU90445.1 preprotein translocase subunit SecY [Dyadobacter sediminis]GGC07810.1 protein translocase subunit SecY [Dyadobacter sediminis]
MKRFLETIKHIFAIEELRTRILNTLLFITIFRLGSYVALPGVEPDQMNVSTQGLLGLLDTFLGGAFSKASIFALGIMPYISASIAIQLLTMALPYFQKMQKEGESGRKKLNQITRVLTIVVTLVQGTAYLNTTVPDEALLVSRSLFSISSVFVLTAGTMFCMWLGERITDKGIGNGISMLIMIGIVSRFPGAIYKEFVSRGSGQILLFVLEIVALYFVIMGAVMLTQAVRRIPIQYAKQVVGNRVMGGQRQYLPLKLNAAGVMPIIFAQALMFIPSLGASYFAEKSDFASNVATIFANYTTWQYNLLFAVLIIIFTFFYTAISVNPQQIADDMKRGGGFIPGVKPGQQTSEYISSILDRITFPGSLMLAIVATLPAFASLLGISTDFAHFFGGTSLLIMVGVVLDTLQQVESYLLMRRYEGLMKSGRVKGRTESVAI